jgi:hypothetical protein
VHNHPDRVTSERKGKEKIVEGGQDIVTQGISCATSTSFRRGEGVVARISKHRFALSDTYGIETVPSEDDGLISLSPLRSTRWPTMQMEETTEGRPSDGAPPSKEGRATIE